MAASAHNVNSLKNHNRALIFSHIRRQPMSRIQLSHLTGLTKSAITIIASDLIREGQLIEMGATRSTVGRKPITLDIVKDFKYAVGVSLHRKRVTVSVVNLKSELLDYDTAALNSFNHYADALVWICGAINRLLQKNNILPEKLVGIGVSCPGPLDYEQGVILTPPNFNMFHNTPIVKLLKEQFYLPVYLENNAVLLAMNEYFYGSMKNFSNSIFVIISNGIGSSIIMNGEIYRGFKGHSGELGHTSIDYKGAQCTCGGRGCLEQYATLKALKARFGFESYETVIDDAYLNKPYALNIVEYLVDCLSSAFVNVVNLFDLDSIILFGEYAYRNELLIDKLNTTVNSRSIINRAHQIKVLWSELNPDAPLISDTAVLLNNYFNQQIDY